MEKCDLNQSLIYEYIHPFPPLTHFLFAPLQLSSQKNISS
jgi:hypothetical protein